MSAAGILAEHRVAAELTRLDLDVLDVVVALVRAVLRAGCDGDVDRAAAGLGALVGALPATHPIVLAVRAGLEVGDGRRAHRRLLKAASLDVHGGDLEFWRRFALNHIPYAELQRRRAVPGPLASDRSPAR